MSLTNCDHIALSKLDLEVLLWSTQASSFSLIFPSYLQNNMLSSCCPRHLKADGPLTAA